MNKNNNSKKQSPLGRLIYYIFINYPARIITVLICIVLSAISSVAAVSFLQKLIDECILPGISNGFDSVKRPFFGILATMATIYIIGVVATFLYSRIMAFVTQGTLRKMRDDMFDQMETLPLRYFDTNAHGDIMSTYTNDTDAIRQLIGQSLPTLISAGITIVSIFYMMLNYSLWMTLVVLVFIVIMVKVTGNLGGQSSFYMNEQQKSLAREEGFIEEMMNGQKVIKVFCHEEESKKDFVKINDALFNNSEQANKFGNTLMPALGNIGNLMYVVLAVMGGILVYFSAFNVSLSGAGVITIGVIISFLSMSRQLSQTMGMASNQTSMIAMGIAGAQRVFDLIDDTSETDDGYVTLVNVTKDADGNIKESDKKTGTWAWKHPHKADGSITYQMLEGHIELADVDFSYVPEKQILYDVTLTANPGEKIAFVGSTGAGKTTITNLINRFYDIDGGKIRYDGINIRKIKKDDLRRSLGVVLQEVNLFTGTVMDNIRYGKLDATDEECIAAAKLANADSFISRLPDGYDTMLTGNGAALSQGQRQLLSIARAAVADPPVMILDEATSSIDTRTEALVQEGMDNLMKGRTVFVIAHRLSTVRNSDAIIVLDHGHIIENGTHDELIEKRGTYYQLYTGAFELE